MKFFLLIVTTIVVFGSLATTSFNCFRKAREVTTVGRRTFFRASGSILGLSAGVFLMWTIESNTAQEAVRAPNPIDELNRRTDEEAAKVDRPVLESKTHREYVREATKN